jgi:hypothetical protein
LQALRSHHPGKPSGFQVKRMLRNANLWITEYTITYQGRPAYAVSIMEFRNGKVVLETQYFADPFEAPAWRKQWIKQIASGTNMFGYATNLAIETNRDRFSLERLTP